MHTGASHLNTYAARLPENCYMRDSIVALHGGMCCTAAIAWANGGSRLCPANFLPAISIQFCRDLSLAL